MMFQREEEFLFQNSLSKWPENNEELNSKNKIEYEVFYAPE